MNPTLGGHSPRLIKPWQSTTVRDLVDQRRNCHDSVERSKLSKQILREAPRLNRRYASERAREVLRECQDLGRLNQLHRLPVKSETQDTLCDPEKFALILEQVYSSTLPSLAPSRDLLKLVPRFSAGELQCAVKAMKRGRCPDRSGVMIEVTKAGPPTFFDLLLKCFNHTLDAGSVNIDWKRVWFSMVPKSRDQTQPTNCRLIVIFGPFL